MKITSLKVELFLKESQSLKDKRRVVKSLIERIKNKYNVSISQIDKNDSFKKSIIGIVTVSNDARFNDQQLKEVLNFIESNPLVLIVKSELNVW